MKIIKIIITLLMINSAFAKAEDCNITIGASDYAPLTYNDAGNNVIGLDVELVNIIAKQAKCNVTWAPIVPWARVIVSVKTGEYTLTTSASKTPERAEFAKFVAYRPDSTKVFVRKSDLPKLANINNLEDLLTKTDFSIGIYNGYEYGSSFTKLYADPKYTSRFVAVPDSTMSANFLKLQANRIDAVILETVVGIDLIKKGGFKDFGLLGFELDDPGNQSFANLMISRVADSNNKIFDLLTNAVNIVKDSNEYKQILKRYFTAE